MPSDSVEFTSNMTIRVLKWIFCGKPGRLAALAKTIVCEISCAIALVLHIFKSFPQFLRGATVCVSFFQKLMFQKSFSGDGIRKASQGAKHEQREE